MALSLIQKVVAFVTGGNANATFAQDGSSNLYNASVLLDETGALVTTSTGLPVRAPGGGALALDGTDGTGITGPSGAVGIRGWLSGIYKAVAGTLAVTQAGGTGTDYSANAAAIPLSGNSLLKTVPVNAGRNYVEVQNQSAHTIQLVRDDGAGGNATTILLAGTGAGTPGSFWSSRTFKGRVLIYAQTGDQVAAYDE